MYFIICPQVEKKLRTGKILQPVLVDGMIIDFIRHIFKIFTTFSNDLTHRVHNIPSNGPENSHYASLIRKFAIFAGAR